MFIIFVIITILLLFTVMIFSAMASDKTKGYDSSGACSGSGCDGTNAYKCHKNSMYAALITGLATALLAVCLIIYIYTSHSEVRTEGASILTALAGKLSPAEIAELSSKAT